MDDGLLLPSEAVLRHVPRVGMLGLGFPGHQKLRVLERLHGGRPEYSVVVFELGQLVGLLVPCGAAVVRHTCEGEEGEALAGARTKCMDSMPTLKLKEV